MDNGFDVREVRIVVHQYHTDLYVRCGDGTWYKRAVPPQIAALDTLELALTGKGEHFTSWDKETPQ